MFFGTSGPTPDEINEANAIVAFIAGSNRGFRDRLRSLGIFDKVIDTPIILYFPPDVPKNLVGAYMSPFAFDLKRRGFWPHEN